ncbi:MULTISPECIES: NAD(P)H-binding protein [unclassified Cellulophaga]|uniref:NAD(P)H-binding protein n=1 Tax=unclassified Cellulophaga TaxID=2634405 RepID=UPI0026E38FCE|nr:MULTISPECIES: NAD(P)H-binding protein [unclassified Cellulophaga]MDO6489895.1 NAD(P)H-binding protein [Cellulophaga sp. 2_MG-2023]MDO6494911.1 NAD(P)H-binding protein [Cellulophaga sp. 3_MG-2023]
MKNKIAVFGCGWLGLPLATTLQKQGYTINGSTTSKDKLALLEEQSIHPFLVNLNDEDFTTQLDLFLSDVEVLVINIPPRMKTGDASNYLNKMQIVHKQCNIANVKKVIFVSSTSVYGNLNGEITEKTTPKPATSAAKQLVAIEQLFLNDNSLKATIIRFGGLIGNGRHPIYHLVKKDEVSNGNYPINLIDITDCTSIISLIIEKNYWNEIFNAVYPFYPTKEEYYTQIANNKRLKPPVFTRNKSEIGKKVISHNLISVKFYEFNTSI